MCGEAKQWADWRGPEEARELVNLYKNKKLREKLCVRERNIHEGWVSGRFRGLRAAIKFREERKRRFRSVAIVY